MRLPVLQNCVSAFANITCSIVTLDLTSPTAQRTLIDLLEGDDVSAIHYAPSCGTCGLARTIPNGPKPLRDSHHPDGLPHFRALTCNANKLYELAPGKNCYHKSILLCIESCEVNFLAAPCLASAFLHHCMFGFRGRKARVHEPLPEMERMNVSCDGSREHDPWSKLPDGTFATAAEVHYPPLMCSVMASAIVDQLTNLGPSVLALFATQA